MILMWSCPGNMPKYYPGLRDILPFGLVICLSDLGNILAYCHPSGMANRTEHGRHQ